MNTDINTQAQNTTSAKLQAAVKSRGRLKAKAPSPRPTAIAEVIKIGVDQGLLKYAICRQIDGSLQEAPRMMKPEQFRDWLLVQQPLAKRIVVCYEAGLFGFELARWIISHGMECIVMAPIKLDEGGKRVETDKINARDICCRLDRYLAGSTRALTSCRIPTREEEFARYQTRQRQQLVDSLRSLEAQGRCLLWQFGYLQWGQSWWDERQWNDRDRLEPGLVTALTRLREVILKINDQLTDLSIQLMSQVDALPEPLRKLPVGAGWLTMLMLTREMMDWKRFRNRRQVAGFTGLVPSEASTGGSVRQGAITKVGNPVVRRLLIEMAWRFVRYQPDCHAVHRWLPILQNKQAGTRARKKAIVAVARQLAVDLWRLATGQTTAENLGLRVA